MYRRNCFASALRACLIMLGVATSWAQSDRATITGVVTDSSGALIPQVQITATNTQTGASFTGTSNNLGLYSVTGIPIGTYSVRATQPGFKTFERAGFELVASQVLRLDIPLEVGSTTETVVVTGTASLLEKETSTVGLTMDAKELTDLPTNAAGGRDPINLLYATAPTVSNGSNSYWDHLSGSMAFSKTVVIDGADATGGVQGDTPSIGMEAVQEMQLQSGTTNADLPANGGGAVIYEMKSGTNEIHGSAFYYLHNEDLNANGWVNNYWLAQCAPGDTACRRTNERGKDRFNDYGGSLGGPIWKNHTFAFGAYEKYDQNNYATAPNSLTVPTAQMLRGDFSQLLTSGTRTGPVINADGSTAINPCTNSPYLYGQIFDPTQWRSVNGVPCGVPFRNNVIPTNRLSPISLNVAQIYGQYYKPTNGNLYNNFPATTGGLTSRRNLDIKIDHNFSDKNHLSFAYNRLTSPGNWLYCCGVDNFIAGGPMSSWAVSGTPVTNYRLIDTYTITPNLVNAATLSFYWNDNSSQPQWTGDPAQFGFKNNFTKTYFPFIQFTGSNGIGESGSAGFGGALIDTEAWHYQDTVSWQKGRHGFKFGGEYATNYAPTKFGGNLTQYNFSAGTGGPTDSSLTPWVGSGFANMMLGAVQSASVNFDNPTYPVRDTVDLFVTDDVKVNRKLTLNLGLRWDASLPFHDKYGRWTNFDVNAQNPLWGNYKGAWVFSDGKSFETETNYHQFGPRVGGAYALNADVVIRAAYALTYIPIGLNQNIGQGPYQQDYFYTGTNVVQNNITGSTAFNWNNGYPGQTVPYVRNNTQTLIPGPPNYLVPNAGYQGHLNQFNAGVQWAFTKDALLYVNYNGNRGGSLHDGNLDFWRNYPAWSTYRSLLLSGHLYDYITNASSAAAAGVPYPYAGFSGYAYQAINNFPQVASQGQIVKWAQSPIGVSAYDALVVEVKTRRKFGITMDMSYTLGKNTASVQGSSNFGESWGYGFQSLQDYSEAANWPTDYDQRHVIKGYITYDLPIGYGKPFLNSRGWLNAMVGGWTIGFQPTYASGMPIGAINALTSYPGWMGLRASLAPGASPSNGSVNKIINLNDPTALTNRVFDPSIFVDPTTGDLGNTPFRWNDWRNFWQLNENVSLLKHFSFGPEGRIKGIFHADFFNAFNRHSWLLDTSRGSPTFGNIYSATGNRVGQLSARVEW